jgi:hypothetical protein
MVGAIQFDNAWFSAAKTQPVLIQNTGGGIMAGIHFTASRFYPRVDQDIVLIKSISAATGIGDITIRDSTLCWQGNAAASTGTGINVASTVTVGGTIEITGNLIGACAPNGTPGTMLRGITLASSTIAATVVGNRLIQNLTPINLAGTTNLLLSDNAGIDDQPTTDIASATTVTMPPHVALATITGVGTIQTLTPAWTGRRITLIPNGAWATTGGGNIGTTFTATPGKVVTGVFGGTNWNFGGY